MRVGVRVAVGAGGLRIYIIYIHIMSVCDFAARSHPPPIARPHPQQKGCAPVPAWQSHLRCHNGYRVLYHRHGTLTPYRPSDVFGCFFFFSVLFLLLLQCSACSLEVLPTFWPAEHLFGHLTLPRIKLHVGGVTFLSYISNFALSISGL